MLRCIKPMAFPEGRTHPNDFLDGSIFGGYEYICATLFAGLKPATAAYMDSIMQGISGQVEAYRLVKWVRVPSLEINTNGVDICPSLVSISNEGIGAAHAKSGRTSKKGSGNAWCR
jgi:hypothetical protein